MGGYTSKEVSSSAYPGTIYDGSSMESFNFHSGSVDMFGRCFIEVLLLNQLINFNIGRTTITNSLQAIILCLII